MTRISAAIITLDEERRLPGLLDRLDWVDEVVVLDGGSGDATVNVARAAGCRVFVRAFDQFARQRNVAAHVARGDWILSLDADERPTPAMAQEVRACVRASVASAYRVPICSRIFGRRMRFSGTQDDRPVRLFRRRHAWWRGAVHERLMVRGRVGSLRYGLDHETLPDLPSFLAKMDRYTALEAEARMTAGQRPRWHERWLAPPHEVARRLLWKGGIFDGPQGWAFCLLSGLSAWTLAEKHRRLDAPARLAAETWQLPAPERALRATADGRCEPLVAVAHQTE